MLSNFAWYFLSFKGRVSRQEFWLGYLATVIVLLLLEHKLEDLILYLRRPPSGSWYRQDLELALVIPKILARAMLLWPFLAISAKRMHDMNFSGWWVLGLAIFAVTRTDFGGLIFSLGMVIGLLPGTRGVNRFGADPIARSST